MKTRSERGDALAYLAPVTKDGVLGLPGHGMRADDPFSRGGWGAEVETEEAIGDEDDEIAGQDVAEIPPRLRVLMRSTPSSIRARWI